MRNHFVGVRLCVTSAAVALVSDPMRMNVVLTGRVTLEI